MSNISSQSLFRFVREESHLIRILEHCFIPRFSLEKQMYFNSRVTEKYAYPMVCFCDIPLSQVKNHVCSYGSFGIGMKRTWGIKHNLTPVHYQPHDYFLNLDAGRFYNSTAFFSECKNNNKESFLNKLYHSMLVKPYNYGETIYYNEREWRYIVSRDELREWYISTEKGKKQPLYILEDTFERRKSKEKEEDSNPQHRKMLEAPNGISNIHFIPSDINYIIVPKDDDILDMACNIMCIKNRFSDSDKLVLISKIISVERIINDF